MEMKQTRRTVLKAVGSGVLLTGAGTASARRRGASGDDTIVDVLVEDDDFSILVEAVTEAGLAGTLSSDDDQFTVFAPNDAAFADLLGELGVSKEELLARDDLATILLYHVTEGRRYSESVVNAPEIEMLAGGTVDVDGTALTDNRGRSVNIVDTDTEASNGVVHELDGVLLP